MGFYNNTNNFKSLVENLLNDREKICGMSSYLQWELTRPFFCDENHYLVIHHDLDNELMSMQGYLSIESLNDIINQLKQNPDWFATIVQGFRLYDKEYNCQKVYNTIYDGD